jgi:hypothetical protein
MLNANRTPWLIAAAGLLVLVVAGGCGGPDRSQSVFPSLDEKSRMSVLEAQDRQRAMGVQIESIRTRDNALDLCFEMCHRGQESCDLSQELCQYSKKFPRAVALVATCRYSREQCRRHRKNVPRQCNCIWEEGS